MMQSASFIFGSCFYNLFIISLMQKLLPKLLLLLTIFCIIHSVSSEYLKLFMLSEQINNECWVLDTNNLTQIGMGNCQNQIYYINLGLGTPPQFFNFQIDTFRDLIWFPFNQTFANISETFQITNKTTVTFLHRSIFEGSVGSDIVTVLETNISTRSEVAWADKNTNLSLYSYIDGILGLGYSQTPNFLDNAASNNEINSSVFSLQMGGFGQPSVLYYNQLPGFILNANIYVPVVGSQLWQVQVYNIKIAGFDYSNIAAKKMIIDTSTSLMYFNPGLYAKIYARFFSQTCRIESNNKVICPCDMDDWPTIQIILRDLSISIQPSQYFKKYENEDGCVLLIGQTMNEESPILMGSSLMKNYIITFDKQNKQIGFNGQSINLWNGIFVIMQLIMITCALIALGLAIYQVMTIRYIKKQKKQKKVKKQKKQKQSGGRQKLIQLSNAYLDQPIL